MTTTVSIRVTAEIREIDSLSYITIVAAVPETPDSAFDTASTVITGKFDSPGSCTLRGSFRPPPGVSQDPNTISENARWETGSTARHYRATVTESTNTFTLQHHNVPLGVTYQFIQPKTTFDYRFRRVAP